MGLAWLSGLSDIGRSKSTGCHVQPAESFLHFAAIKSLLGTALLLRDGMLQCDRAGFCGITGNVSCPSISLIVVKMAHGPVLTVACSSLPARSIWDSVSQYSK